MHPESIHILKKAGDQRHETFEPPSTTMTNGNLENTHCFFRGNNLLHYETWAIKARSDTSLVGGPACSRIIMSINGLFP